MKTGLNNRGTLEIPLEPMQIFKSISNLARIYKFNLKQFKACPLKYEIVTRCKILIRS